MLLHERFDISLRRCQSHYLDSATRNKLDHAMLSLIHEVTDEPILYELHMRASLIILML